MRTRRPPKLITWFVEHMTSAREAEILLGDMEEEYERRLTSSGPWRADAGYVADFCSLLFHRVLGRDSRSTSSNYFTMLINYIKVALRQVARQKMHHAINVVGLAIGLAVSFMITLYVMHELSYDRFHAKTDRLYLLPMTWKFETNNVPTANTTSGAGPVMKELFPEVEAYVRTQPIGLTFDHERGPIEENSILAADSTFFQLFSFPLIAGDPDRALSEPNSLVLTERAAVKYFGEQWEEKDLLSQTLKAQSGKLYRITGVAKDAPAESHIMFDVLMSISSLPPSQTEPNWETASMWTYVLLAPNSTAESVVADIPHRVAARYGEEHNRHIGLDLIPLADIHLRSAAYPGIILTSDIRYVYIFSATALLVLIIAIINYMNLSTARSMERAREVGVRKAIGAIRSELFWQFVSESVFITLAAVAIALCLVYVALPVFNTISGKDFTMGFLLKPVWVLAMMMAWLFISFLGGAYPAMVLSSFRPAKVLKGSVATIGSGALLRRSLVVFQFGISIFLIVCTLTINDQLSFMVGSRIGVDKERLMALPLDSVAQANAASIRTELLGLTGVENVSMVSSTPINNGRRTTVVGGDIGEKQLILYNMGVDGNFASTSGLELMAGTDLSKEDPQDGSWEFLINESAVGFFGWTNESAIGKRIGLWGTEGVVKGVVRDFHFLPMYRPIEPLLIHSGKKNRFGLLSKMLIRVDGSEMMSLVGAMEERWKKVVPASPFTAIFLDEMYDRLYRSETRLSNIMNVFSTLAVLIAVLGLFGLASYTILQRNKELGIRKVLGASWSSLMVSVSGSFIRLVIVAFVVAAPLSWMAMSRWLQTFPYPVHFSWMLVLMAGLATLLLAVGTVAYHAVAAARVNPAITLRSE